jgi:TM2 domain-containing membrane protein YozV
MRPLAQPPSNVIAAVLSLVIPGAGQMYKGRIGLGIAWLTITLLAYVTLLLPGMLLHFICIFHAAGMEPRRAGAPSATVSSRASG